jgi:hypothetical protein
MKTKFIPIIGLLTALVSPFLCWNCTNSTTPDAPEFIGAWAGYYPPDSLALLSMEFRSDGSYSASIRESGQLIIQLSGPWKQSGQHLIMTEINCASGSPAVLVPCEGPDTLLINVNGDSWPVRYADSTGMTTVIMRRLN